ncbi:MAG: hypothetical protein PHG73_01210 [Pygmaiobacter sp.]|nr:hypothetical protein [Pygmaiobacter sp.]
MNCNSSCKPTVRHLRTKVAKRKSQFFCRFSILTGSAFFIVLLILLFLWFYLADYQAQLPTMLCDKIQAAYQADDVAVLQQYCTDLPGALQDAQVFREYLNTPTLQNDLYYYESSSTADSITYSFRTGAATFAELTVSATGEKSWFGFPVYAILSLKQYALGTVSLIENPGTHFLLEGKPIDADYLTDVASADSSFAQIGTKSFSIATYTIPDYLAINGLSAAEDSGTACALTWNSDRTVCSASLSMDAQSTQSLSDFAIGAAKAYAVFATLQNAPLTPLLPYLYPNTVFYQTLLSYRNNWGVPKTDDAYENVSVTDCARYSETEYYCIVSLDYIVTQGTQTKTFPIRLGCCITAKSGNYKIINMTAVS